MPTLYSPLVGSHFRPPASLLLQHLPLGTELYLEPEPSNPYDPNALAVYLPAEELVKLIENTNEEFENELLNYGWTSTALQENSPIHLGYIAASEKTAFGYSLNTAFLSAISGTPDWIASLSFTPEGRPLVRLNY